MALLSNRLRAWGIPVHAVHHPRVCLSRSVSLVVDPPPFPVIDRCPDPTCPCAPMPEALDIEREKSMIGTVPYYSEHLVVATGHSSWPSRIEEEPGGLANVFKGMLRKNAISNLDRKHMVSNSNLKSNNASTTVYMFPRFKVVAIKNSEQTMQTMSDSMSKNLLSASLDSSSFQDVKEVVILICGHGNRDSRCGIMGPLLQAEFEKSLAHSGVNVHRPTDPANHSKTKSVINLEATSALVGQISHVGGHKFAGNAIIYIPPSFRIGEQLSPLAGKGIWYGRVEPRHVQGIIRATILEGKVISELLRGTHPL